MEHRATADRDDTPPYCTRCGQRLGGLRLGLRRHDLGGRQAIYREVPFHRVCHPFCPTILAKSKSPRTAAGAGSIGLCQAVAAVVMWGRILLSKRSLGI